MACATSPYSRSSAHGYARVLVLLPCSFSYRYIFPAPLRFFALHPCHMGKIAVLSMGIKRVLQRHAAAELDGVTPGPPGATQQPAKSCSPAQALAAQPQLLHPTPIPPSRPPTHQHQPPPPPTSPQSPTSTSAATPSAVSPVRAPACLPVLTSQDTTTAAAVPTATAAPRTTLRARTSTAAPTPARLASGTARRTGRHRRFRPVLRRRRGWARRAGRLSMLDAVGVCVVAGAIIVAPRSISAAPQTGASRSGATAPLTDTVQ